MKTHYKDFFLYIIALIVALLVVLFLFSTSNNSQQKELQNQEATSSARKVKQYSSPPEMKISKDKKYKALMKTTKSSITIDLFAKETPTTVNNFVFLSKEGFYDGTMFHRIIKDFMIQGGDPKGNGTGGPGYQFNDEKITRDYKRGVVAMANSGPNTNGSQFFVIHKDYNLPKQYVIFGQVIEGMETVDAIAEVSTVDNGTGEKSKPTEEIRIETIEIREE